MILLHGVDETWIYTKKLFQEEVLELFQKNIIYSSAIVGGTFYQLHLGVAPIKMKNG